VYRKANDFYNLILSCHLAEAAYGIEEFLGRVSWVFEI
jgi:hypothetical protein